MELNPTKCSLISIAREKGVAVPRTHSNITIDSQLITTVNKFESTTYLGHEVAAKGYLKPSIVNLVGWCGNLQKALLKPDQKLIILRNHPTPRLLYGLQTPGIEAQVLTAADRIIRSLVKKILHLNIHTRTQRHMPPSEMVVLAYDTC